jgi:uncharacterized protein YdaU (DUF1376 family)
MTRPWMPLYVSDYRADTAHLSTLEHGAYLLLIMHYWQKDGLPTDEKQLAKVAGLTLRQWLKMGPTLAAFFGDGWTHKRIDDELQKAKHITKNASVNAKKRWAKSLQNNKTDDAKAYANAYARARARTVVVDVIDTNTQSKEISSKPARAEKSRLGPPKKSPREELEVILSPRMADAVLEHRQRLRKPLSSLAASALASSFQETGDPEAAAFTMIERGWQGFQPDWLNGDRQPQKGRH